jgi:5-carboxymethyl-2-hydroxymuconate isomerase
MVTVKVKGREQDVPVGKIVCIGRNYAEHARELGNVVPDSPILFMKPASCLVHDGGTVIIPSYSEECHHEVELAVLIGKEGHNIQPDFALEHAAGYAIAIDLTLRDIQNQLKEKGHPWEIAKAFDTSCPLSDFVPAESVADPQDLNLKLSVNGELRQDGNSSDMMRSVAQIIVEMSKYFTLEPGDILLTGTPAGVSALQNGDTVEASIEGVGTLKVFVA